MSRYPADPLRRVFDFAVLGPALGRRRMRLYVASRKGFSTVKPPNFRPWCKSSVSRTLQPAASAAATTRAVVELCRANIVIHDHILAPIPGCRTGLSISPEGDPTIWLTRKL